MIEVNHLTKLFGNHAAVDGVTFSAERGEIVGFLGPNGAGKTTTMRMLTCFLPPTSGGARIAGFDILDQSFDVRKRVGYLPESVPLYRDLTVSAFLDFAGTLKGLARKERARRAGSVMEECGVTDVKERPIGKLSRGYRQRVGLAQALMGDPEVLILDEPTVGLDPKQIIEIRELIRGLAGKRTVVLSTHILPEVSLLCNRVIIINDGKLITDDAPQNLGRRLSRANVVEVTVRAAYDAVEPVLRDIDGVTAIARLDSDTDHIARVRVESPEGTDIREAIVARVVASSIPLLELTARDMSLEDIFVRLVTREGTEQ